MKIFATIIGYYIKDVYLRTENYMGTNGALKDSLRIYANFCIVPYNTHTTDTLYIYFIYVCKH